MQTKVCPCTVRHGTQCFGFPTSSPTGTTLEVTSIESTIELQSCTKSKAHSSAWHLQIPPQRCLALTAVKSNNLIIVPWGLRRSTLCSLSAPRPRTCCKPLCCCNIPHFATAVPELQQQLRGRGCHRTVHAHWAHRCNRCTCWAGSIDGRNAAVWPFWGVFPAGKWRRNRFHTIMSSTSVNKGGARWGGGWWKNLSKKKHKKN